MSSTQNIIIVALTLISLVVVMKFIGTASDPTVGNLQSNFSNNAAYSDSTFELDASDTIEGYVISNLA